MAQFIEENCSHLISSVEYKGKVFVGFTITKKGNIRDVRILRGINKLYDLEAVKVVKLTDGCWTPGRIIDKYVDMKMIVPVLFK